MIQCKTKKNRLEALKMIKKEKHPIKLGALYFTFREFSCHYDRAVTNVLIIKPFSKLFMFNFFHIPE